jgi:hypothetical protein
MSMPIRTPNQVKANKPEQHQAHQLHGSADAQVWSPAEGQADAGDDQRCRGSARSSDRRPEPRSPTCG